MKYASFTLDKGFQYDIPIEKYEYICFFDDKPYEINSELSQTVRRAHEEHLWKNTVNNPEYINGVVDLFKSDNSLGLVFPPNCYHSVFFSSLIQTSEQSVKKI